MFVYVCEVYCVKHVFFILNSYQKLRIRIFFVRELKRFALSLQIRFFCLNSFALCIGFGKNMRIELRKYLNSIYIYIYFFLIYKISKLIIIIIIYFILLNFPGEKILKVLFF